MKQNISAESFTILRFINIYFEKELVEETGNREKKAIVVAPCAWQKLVFNIYGPEPGGGGGWGGS